eukprot:CAMPEP_0174827006 /NCGR_PEP_ID=MMETSP1114-20130205/409_1 /TAXON_ID=312471 /ORGANISM="Neobodo designis, Strain CCAP 1951/1" /LENGTH=138 /DNA_ID=CAMNT_0016060593 /DNA_START=135 /DNA_END=551 /DNA_ORIENTATION=+
MLTRRLAPTVAAPAAAMAQARSYIEISGETKFRLEKMTMEKDHKAALAKYQEGVTAKQAKTYANRKEELEHLTQRPDYEYVSDNQRAANDLTAVTSSPHHYMTDVPYHYQKLWKAITMSKTHHESGNGEIKLKRVVPQ